MLFRRNRTAPAAEQPNKHLPLHHRLWRDWLLPLIIVAAVLAPIRSVVADWNDVPSGSMRPTILEGDRIYVNKLAYGLRVPFTTTWLARWDAPHRGEIVTLKSPADGVRLVKRVVGVPGDLIAMRDNILYINGEAAEVWLTDDDLVRGPDGRLLAVQLAEEKFESDDAADVVHALTLVPGDYLGRSFPEFRVPEDEYFVLGDNRDMSRDSRAIGTVPLQNIYGRTAYVALSLDPENNYLPRWRRWFSALR